MTPLRSGLRRRASLGVLAAFAIVAASAAVSPGLVASAADLITGKDIKDGTIKKADLAPKVRSKLGVPGPAGQVGPVGPVGEKGTQGIQGLPGQPGDPATADGPAIMMGRMNNPSAQTVCLVGPPSGLAENSGGCNLAEVDDNRMPVPRSVVVRNFTVVSTTTVPGGNDVFFFAFHGPPGTTSGPYCEIPSGQATCTIPPFTVSAGELMAMEFDWETGAVPAVSYAYELWSPTAVSAAVLAEAKVNSAEATGPLPALMR